MTCIEDMLIHSNLFQYTYLFFLFCFRLPILLILFYKEVYLTNVDKIYVFLYFKINITCVESKLFQSSLSNYIFSIFYFRLAILMIFIHK